MGIYPRKIITTGGINHNETTEGIPVEQMWTEMLESKEIGGLEGKELMYPQEGIPYGTDIRGNKWDKAISETDKVTKAITAARERKTKIAQEKRDEQLKKQAEERGDKGTKSEKSDGGTASSE